MASLGDEEGQRVGGLARPPTVSSHHPKLPNQDLRERLEDCTVGNQEADGQGPRAGEVMEKASMEGTQGLEAEGSEASLPLCGVPKGHLCVDSQGCLRTVIFSQVENKGLEAGREVLTHSCTRTRAQI